ncbi:MAG: hypothetical protein ACOC93_04710 [Planctomycetota bacterium]
MDAFRQSAPRNRAVVFARRGMWAAGEMEGPGPAAPELRWVETAYEAAAELLGTPPAVLALDLGLLERRHVRLLELARQREVPVLAFGHLPAGLDSEQLSGVRLISSRRLMEEIARAVGEVTAGRPQAPPPSEVPAQQAHPAPQPDHLPPTGPPRPVEEAPSQEQPPAPAPEPAEPSRKEPTDVYVPFEAALDELVREIEAHAESADQRGEQPAEQTDRTEEENQDRSLQTPRSLLTPDELSALLED